MAVSGAILGTSAAGLSSAAAAAASVAPAASTLPAASTAAEAIAGRSITLDAVSAPAGSPKSLRPALTASSPVSGGGSAKQASTPKAIARSMLSRFHWSHRQFKYLNRLWMRESSWNVYASNPSSGAYGIPQAVPGSKMASAGSHWRTSARTQVRWGLRYIQGRYGSPRQAWDHELSAGWY